MILILVGIYSICTSKLPITRNYGLMGTGARIAGALLIAFGLGLYTILSVPIMVLTTAIGLPEGAVGGITFLFQIAALIATMVILVRIYRNAYEKTPPGS